MDIDQIVDLINKKINIPYLSEEQEKVLIKAVLLIMINFLPRKEGKEKVK